LKTGSAFGTREDRRFRYIGPVNLRAGTNRIALLSVAVGLPVSLFFSTFTFQKKSYNIQVSIDAIQCQKLIFQKKRLRFTFVYFVWFLLEFSYERSSNLLLIERVVTVSTRSPIVVSAVIIKALFFCVLMIKSLFSDVL